MFSKHVSYVNSNMMEHYYIFCYSWLWW